MDDSICAMSGGASSSVGKTCYTRVSSHDQARQIDTQAARLQKHCEDAGFADIEVITDSGSGLINPA
ncbi:MULTISPECIES: recombinase family protein [Paraburkholderia]|uniref:recombinase family protein n=1 Tax=Paraburkholderia TaxID=1822464 RepID=UPI0038BB7C25